MRGLSMIRTALVKIWLPVILVALWWFSSANSDHLYFPSLQSILTSLVEDWILGDRWRTDLLPSLTNFAIGFFISIGGGAALGLLLGQSDGLRAFFSPILTFFRALPSPALIPIVLALFGIGSTMNISLIILGAIWPTLLNTIDGVRSVDPQVLDTARSYQLSRIQVIRFVVLPSAGPAIFSGFRISLQLAIILIVVSEMVGATRGVGYFVIEAQQTFMVVQTWVGTVLLGVLGYLATILFLSVEKRAIRWQYRMIAASK